VSSPTLRVERMMLRQGAHAVACADEVGRGALSGPVTVGMVVITAQSPPAPRGVRDSKLLSSERRERLAPHIRQWAPHAVGHASPAEVDAIGIIAVLNGALVQIIMASRVLYGLGNQGLLPAGVSGTFARINPFTQTPLIATGLITGIILALALGFGLAGLAETTSLVTLTIFTLVNGALIRIRLRDGKPAEGVCYPLAVPGLGLLVSLGFLVLGLAG